MVDDDYVMPPVTIGQVVLWHEGGHRNEHPAPAIVVKVGNEALCLATIIQNISNFILRDGGRHLDDPKVNREDPYMGAWEHTAENKELANMRIFVREAQRKSREEN